MAGYEREQLPLFGLCSWAETRLRGSTSSLQGLLFLNSSLASLTNACICQRARKGLPCWAAGSGHLKGVGLCHVLVCSPVLLHVQPSGSCSRAKVGTHSASCSLLVFFHDSIKAARAVRHICFCSRAHCHIVIGQKWREEGS